MPPSAGGPSDVVPEGQKPARARPKPRSKQPAGLVFVNITKPEDTRNADYRTKVARTAMINRPRPDNNDSKTRLSVSSTGSRSSSTQRHRKISSTSSAARQDQDPSTTGATSSISPPLQYTGTGFTSPPELSYGTASPESNGISPPTLVHYDSNGSDVSLQYGQPANDSYFDVYDSSVMANNGYTGFEQYDTSPPLDMSTDYGNTSYLTGASTTPPQETAIAIPNRRNRLVRNNEQPQSTQVVRAVNRRNNRRNNNNGSYGGAEASNGSSWNLMGDISINSIGGMVDPFDVLPMKANAHTQELLYQYVGAHLMSPQLGGRGSPVHQRLTDSRRRLWWPMVMRSKAAMCALIVYVETTPDLPNKSPNETYLDTHKAAAITAIREGIETTGKNQVTDDEICFAIVLLMIAAQRSNDKLSTQIHAKGLRDILDKRAEMFARNRKLEIPTAEKGLSFPAPAKPSDPAARCLYCRSNPHREPDSRGSSPELEDVPVDTDNMGQGFKALVDASVLSGSMQAFINTSLEWNGIAQRARKDRLSAACGASHAWTDGNIKDEAQTPFDMAVMFSVRIALYLSAWQDWNHSCAAVKELVGAVNMSLKEVLKDSVYMDNTLMVQCPDILLWATLLAGPYTENEETRLFMLKLAGRAAAGMELILKLERRLSEDAQLSFDQALVEISRNYLWTSTMTPAARAFFHEGVSLWQQEEAIQAPAPRDYEHYLAQLHAQQNAQYNQQFADLMPDPTIGLNPQTSSDWQYDQASMLDLQMQMNGFISDEALQNDVQGLTLEDSQWPQVFGQNGAFLPTDNNGADFGSVDGLKYDFMQPNGMMMNGADLTGVQQPSMYQGYPMDGSQYQRHF